MKDLILAFAFIAMILVPAIVATRAGSDSIEKDA